MTLPANLEFGRVVGRFLQSASDDGSEETPASGTITFQPVAYRLIGGDTPATITLDSVVGTIDSADGILVAQDGTPGVWLAVGWYDVTCKFSTRVRASFTVEVTAAHTQANPLDLTVASPITPNPSVQFVVNEQIYLDTLQARDEAQAYSAGMHAITHHIGGSDELNVVDIGGAPASHTHSATHITEGVLSLARLPVGTVGGTVAAGNDSRLSNARTPTAHAATHHAGAADALSLAALSSGAATAGQVPKADGSGGIAWAAESLGGHVIHDEGAPLSARPALNFIGTGVAVTDNAAAGSTDVTITAANSLTAEDTERIATVTRRAIRWDKALATWGTVPALPSWAFATHWDSTDDPDAPPPPAESTNEGDWWERADGAPWPLQ